MNNIKVMMCDDMPYISTHVSLPLSKNKELTLKEKLGQAIALIPGKSCFSALTPPPPVCI